MCLAKLCLRRACTSASASGSGHVERISSTTNTFVKHCVKLRTSAKYRQESGTILLVGAELLAEAAGGSAACAAGGSSAAAGSGSSANPGRLRVRALVLLDPPAPELLQPGGVPWLEAQRTVVASEPVMKKLAGLESAAAVDAVAEMDLPRPADFLRWPPRAAAAAALAASGRSGQAGEGSSSSSDSSASQSPPLRRLLALDGVQDPGNLGTLLRSALAFGWDGVFLLTGCCSPFNDKAVKSSRGAVLRTPIGHGSIEDLMQVADRHGLHLVAADVEDGERGPGGGGPGAAEPAAGAAPSAAAAAAAAAAVSPAPAPAAAAAAAAAGAAGAAQPSSPPPPQQPRGVCLVLGSEGHGLSAAVRRACTPVSIPQVGPMESLNVGVAGGILMFALAGGGGPGQLACRLKGLGLLEPSSAEGEEESM